MTPLPAGLTAAEDDPSKNPFSLRKKKERKKEHVAMGDLILTSIRMNHQTARLVSRPSIAPARSFRLRTTHQLPLFFPYSCDMSERQSAKTYPSIQVSVAEIFQLLSGVVFRITLSLLTNLRILFPLVSLWKREKLAGRANAIFRPTPIRTLPVERLHHRFLSQGTRFPVQRVAF